VKKNNWKKGLEEEERKNFLKTFSSIQKASWTGA
jgi:hypothetical protein